jgi:hypothetical protein
MMANEPEAGARKVGTYDIPDDRKQGGAPPPPPEQRSGLGWLWWLLGIILLLALLAWAFQSFFNPGPAATVTPTAEAAVTDAAADTAGEDAAGAGAAGAVDNTAFCTAITDYDTLAAEAPAITADTATADVRGYYERVAVAGGALTSAAASVPDLDLTGFNTALGTLGESIAGLTGDVVGDAADGLNAAFTGLTTAFGGLRTTAACQ